MAQLKVLLATVFALIAYCSLLMIIWADSDDRFQWALTCLAATLPALALVGSILEDNKRQAQERAVRIRLDDVFGDDRG